MLGQTPPIKIFPTPHTSHLPYNEQSAIVEADYAKYYEYRGDLPYNENMRRAICKTANKNEQKEKRAEKLLASRVCRDRNTFVERRALDDVVILTEVLKSMIETTAEMEKFMENVLLDAGETDLPNWDEIYDDLRSKPKEIMAAPAPPPPSKAKIASRPKVKNITIKGRKPKPTTDELNQPSTSKATKRTHSMLSDN